MIDIEAQLPLRRFVDSLLDDSHIVVHSKLSGLKRRPDGKLFSQVHIYCFFVVVVFFF
jgi:intron-binding protein aquarius